MTEDFIPDFSGDDFANDKEILKTRAAIKAYEDMIADSLSIIREELRMEDAAHINLKGFQMFKSLTATITHSMKSYSSSKEFRISLADYFSSYPVPRALNSGTDKYIFGHLKLQSDYPRTYVHKETIREKIEDIILKRDLDFSHSKKFSRQFQVLTEDQNKLEGLLLFKNLDNLSSFPEMELEISKNELLFRSSRKPISIEEAGIFCELTKTLLTIFK